MTFVLPVYNAQSLLEGTLRKVHAWLSARPEVWELVIVDDCSTDGSHEIIERFALAHEGAAISRIRFTENRGKGFAIRVGLGLARGTYVIFTDCDLAYPVENASRVLAQLEAGADVSIACRVLPESTYLISPSFFSYLYTRHVMGRFFNLLCRVLTVPRLLDTQAGLKGFRTEVVRPILGRLVMNGFSFDVELLRALMDRDARIVETAVSFRYDSEPSTVRFVYDSAVMLRDLLHIRYRSLRGAYLRDVETTDPARLVVRADDFGLSPGVNQAIQEGLEAGFLTSTSIMLGTPHAPAAMRWAADHPGFSFGVHLNLTQGRPVLPTGQVRSLVDGSGEFYPLGRFLFRFFTGRVRSKQVRSEWRAQIAAVRAAGVRVAHLDSHHHVHLLPRFCSKITLPLAKEEGIPVRAMDGPVRGRGRWPDLKGLLLSLASRAARRAGIDRFVEARGSGTALMRRPTLAVLQSLLLRMKPGRTYELVVHPGIVDLALRDSGDAYLAGREKEQQLLASEEYRAALRHHGIELTEPSGTEAADTARSAGSHRNGS
ncbi:MAG TPA: ChbG/HpnK family deacetylase [Patescibacteria group bacterium]|nr:ChbG/HpnK family deacetylase [Patescibacteria group bacterium]